MSEFQHLLTQLATTTSQLGAGARLRAKAWALFQENGLPTRQNDAYRYLNLKDLYATPFRLGLVRLESESLLPLALAWKRYDAFLQGRFRESLKEERDPFALVNTALYSDGGFLYIPPGSTMDLQRIVVELPNEPEASLYLPRLHIVVGAKAVAALEIVVNHRGTQPFVLNQFIDIAIEEGAQLELGMQMSELAHGKAFNAVRTTLKQSASLKLLSLSGRSRSVRNDFNVRLLGEDSQAELKGSWILVNDEEAHTHVKISHLAPHCRSLQLFKGVLSGSSRASFTGMIDVEDSAQKTDAFQLNKNLLLSDTATAITRPELEIRADDVKASHGATVGQIDQDELFYLKARGLAHNRAVELLLQAFVAEGIQNAKFNEMRLLADRLISDVTMTAHA